MGMTLVHGMTRSGVGLLGGPLAYTRFGAIVFMVFALGTATAIAIAIWAVARKKAHTATPVAVTASAPYAPPAADTALAIVRERLARGEIEPDQYTAIVAALNGGQTAAPQV